ncbi:MAG: hypothetical protein ACLFUJ_09825 [Phycisphaerae bacterium]
MVLLTAVAGLQATTVDTLQNLGTQILDVGTLQLEENSSYWTDFQYISDATFSGGYLDLTNNRVYFQTVNGVGASSGTTALDALVASGHLFSSTAPADQVVGVTVVNSLDFPSSGFESQTGPWYVAALTWNSDANVDGEVGIGDLGILAGNYGLENSPAWSMGDFNGDGTVGIGDLGILAGNYGKSILPPAVLTIDQPSNGQIQRDEAALMPEPLTAGAMAMAVGGLCGYLRRRKAAA